MFALGLRISLYIHILFISNVFLEYMDITYMFDYIQDC